MKFASRAMRGISRASIFVGAAAIPCTLIGASASASASASAAHVMPVPKGFIANSITWTSPQRGWVLGAQACAQGKGTCPDSQVVGTTNGGATWRLIGTIQAPIPKLGLTERGITEIRFATSKVGWAFAPGLFRSSNGGKTWRSMPIPGHGKQVLDLAVTSTAAYAIVSPCGYGMGICNSQPLSAWRTNQAGTSWTRMPLKLHIDVSANVAAYGSTVYVVNPRVERGSAQLYASTDGGVHFAARRDPCSSAELYNLIQAAPYSATKVAFLCDGNPGFSKAAKAVYRSANTGKTDTYAGTMGAFGIQAWLTVSSSGNLAVDSWSDGSFIYINDTTGTTWHMIIGSGDGGAGFNDITYVSKRVAWVVYGPADMFSGYGQIGVTRDAGRHWHFRTL